MKSFFPRPVVFAAIIAVLAGGFNPARAETRTIVAVGDSLTAGLGLKLDEAFPAQLEAALRAKGHDVKVVNAGVSGETTSGLKGRLAWTLREKPDGVIVEIGANDMLRAVDPAVTRANLSEILSWLEKEEIPVLLAGMKSFSNFGAEYAADHARIYADVAEAHKVAAFYPFFLDGVAMQPQLMQDDGLHPSAEGVAEIVRRITPYAEKLLEEEK